MDYSDTPEAGKERGRRITIDLSPAAASEIDRLSNATGMTVADVFRNAMSMFHRHNGQPEAADQLVADLDRIAAYITRHSHQLYIDEDEGQWQASTGWSVVGFGRTLQEALHNLAVMLPEAK